MCRNAVNEQKYEEICARLARAKRHVIDTKDWFVTLKANKPRLVRQLLLALTVDQLLEAGIVLSYASNMQWKLSTFFKSAVCQVAFEFIFDSAVLW